MRRLGFFVISLLVFVGVFTSENSVFAQTTSSDQGSYSYYSDQGNQLFANAIQGFQTAKASVDAAKNDPKQAFHSATLSKYITLVQNAQSTYTTAFSQGSAAGKTPPQTQLDAIAATNMALQNGFDAFTTPEKTDPVSRAIYNTFTTQLTHLFQQAGNIKVGQTTAGSLSASSTVNATAPATAGKSAADAVSNTDASKCSVWSWTITNCIDAAFAWLLRNTLLAVAGVLLKISASILNLSVSQGILNFKSWAPDTLYSAWLVIRQIVSLVVVFAGLYLGFMYIIGREDAFTKYIGWLVIFALFVNFSYPITRMLTDVSNVVSLNIYSSILGPQALDPNSSTTAGTLLMQRLGLEQDIKQVNDGPKSVGTTDLSSLSSTPNVLILIAFVCYAAYVLFMTAGILILRTIALVMLTIASPILLIDSVIPKLGDAAVKMRKIFFEQLIVAPVFMILFALTLKFMDVFHSNNTSSTALVFFNLLMMIIMLHIMFKITKDISGKVGEAATNAMGKVGGFGLAAATMGSGMLARGTIGAAAGRLRDSAWMDKLQGSSVGRGLYGISNSLAQSTFDARNIGMVQRGMATAGLTGGMGLTMQQGLRQNADQRFAAREAAVLKKGQSIRDDDARGAYFKRANILSPIRPIKQETLRGADREVMDKRQAALAAFSKATGKERQAMMDGAKDDYVLQQKMRVTNGYLAIDSKNDPDMVRKKVDELMKLNNADEAKRVIESDPFTDIQEAYKKDIEQREAELESKSKTKKMVIDGVEQNMSEYEYHRQQIGLKKKEMRDEIESKRKEILQAYKDRNNEITHGAVDVDLNTPYTAHLDAAGIETDAQATFRTADNGTRPPERTFDTSELDRAGVEGSSPAPGPTFNPAPPGSGVPFAATYDLPSQNERRTLENPGGSKNTYPITNTIEQLPDGRFLYGGQVFQSITDAAAAKAQGGFTATAGGPTPAPAPRSSTPAPAPGPGPAPAPKPSETAEAVA